MFFNANDRKDEMRTIRQVRLNKTLDDIRKIVGFKKLTEGTSKNWLLYTEGTTIFV